MVSKPSRLPIGYIGIRVFAHATEDAEKVMTAVRRMLPETTGENVVFEKTVLTGHHGNPIVLLEAKLEDRLILPDVLQRIGNGLTALDKETLDSELKLHLEKGNLYLRFDKQQAFLGASRFSTNDPIHFKVHFKNRTADEIANLCRELGLLP
ncbi:MAG TPA: RNA-binding domain-containing protein [Candidatus Bathyarchaeia archaeon]